MIPLLKFEKMQTNLKPDGQLPMEEEENGEGGSGF